MSESLETQLRARSLFTKSSYDAWIVENGRLYESDKMTYAGKKRMAKRQCFSNASRLAIADNSLTYCEGYVSVYGIPIHHAWLIDKNDKVRDPTLRYNRNMPPQEYFGVAFSTEYIIKAMLINDVYGILDGYYNRKTIHDLLNGHEKNWRGR